MNFILTRARTFTVAVTLTCIAASVAPANSVSASAAGSAATVSALQPQQRMNAAQQQTPLNLSAIPVDRLETRLAALSPEDPAAYFELAELIAAEQWAPGAVQLARTLFVLTLEIQRANDPAGRAGGLAASACFGLAQLASTEEERRWLLAVAGLLSDPGSHATNPLATRAVDADDPAFHLATALGFTRAGLGRRAQQLLDRPGVSELLERYERLLDPAGLDGGARRIRAYIQAWPQCPECRNRRIVTTATRGEVRREVCPTCKGNPGPQLDPREEVLQLRLEALLLRGIHRSWGAQAIADAGAPLRDADPAEIAPVYRVNPAETLFRNGRWTAPQPTENENNNSESNRENEQSASQPDRHPGSPTST